MVRTIISIDDETKAWLDEQASREGLSMTALIRRARALGEVGADGGDEEALHGAGDGAGEQARDRELAPVDGELAVDGERAAAGDLAEAVLALGPQRLGEGVRLHAPGAGPGRLVPG